MLTIVARVSTSVPPTPVLTPFVPFTTLRFPPFASRGPLRTLGFGQVHAPPDPITEATLVTATCFLETVPTPSDPQCHIIFGTGLAAATPTIGFYPPGQFVSPLLHLVPHWHCNSAFPLTRPLKSGTSTWRSLPRYFRAWLCLSALLQLLLHLRSLCILFLLSRHSLLHCRPGHHPSCSLLQ